MRALCLALSLILALLAFADFTRFVDGAAHRALCSFLLVCGLYCLYHALRRPQPAHSGNAEARARFADNAAANSRELLNAVESLAEALAKARHEVRRAGNAGQTCSRPLTDGQTLEKTALPPCRDAKGPKPDAVWDARREDGEGNALTKPLPTARMVKALEACARAQAKKARPRLVEKKPLSSAPARSRRKAPPRTASALGRKKTRASGRVTKAAPPFASGP